MAKDESLSDQVVEKLDIVARLLAYLVAAEHDSLKDRAVALSALGLSPTEIARVCGTTPNTVSVRLAEAKGKQTKKSARHRKPNRKG